MAKTSERPCIAYQRDTPPSPLPKKGFLMSCITRCKPENRAPNSQVLGSTCTPVSCSLHLPLPFPLPPPAGSHKSLPPFKTPSASCSFCVKFFDKQYPNNKNNNSSAAQHTGRGTVGRHSSVPVTFLHFSANGAAPSLPSPTIHNLAPLASSVQKLHQIHENIFQKLH